MKGEKKRRRKGRKEGRKEGSKERGGGIEFSSKYEWAGVKSTLFMSGRIVILARFIVWKKTMSRVYVTCLISFLFFFLFFFFPLSLFSPTIIFNDALILS